MSDTPTIRPALTPEEWATKWVECGDMSVRVRDGALDLTWGVSRYDEVTVDTTAADQLKLAARILHGHPQGFTRADVALIRSRFDLSDDQWRTDEESAAASLAARIEALLPPEGA